MKLALTGVLAVAIVLLVPACSKKNQEEKLRMFIDAHVKVIQPLNTAYAEAFWKANATGEKQYYDQMEKLELQIREIYSKSEDFKLLKEMKDGGGVEDPMLQRQLILLYNAYLPNQMDADLRAKIVKLSTKIAGDFNTFRATLDGKQVSDNQIMDILKSERNSDKRKAAWEASKQVGAHVVSDLVQLVKLRNQAAVKLGYKNYYEMMMEMNEQKADEVAALFDKLKAQSDEPFRALKASIDSSLAAKYKIPVADLRPWHYEDPFFQKAPQVSAVDFDAFYKKRDIMGLAAAFYNDIHLPVGDIIGKSDLFERDGKYPHAFCIDVNREGDVRVMLNITDNVNWMETMLHELGHAVYSKFIDRKLPYLLRAESHILTTEAIAQMMERQAKNPDWMQNMLGITDAQKAAVTTVVKEQARLKALVFARWSMVMMNFERAMYENPDQDLNALWWTMVEKYQFLKRPEGRNAPDFAAKIHLSQSPVYYHNYLLGELMASQLMHTIATQVFGREDAALLSFYKEPKVGDFLKEKVFAPGTKLAWNDLIRFATGEPLNPDYYVTEFMK